VLTTFSGLSVKYDGEDIGKNGIAEAKIYFWNSGTLPILQDEILDPYVISLPVRILAHRVLKSNREVVGFSVSHEKSSNELALHFAVLEPGDGATLVLLFDGPRNTEIKFKGACLNAPKPTVLPPDPIYFRPPGLRRFGETYGSLLLIVLFPVVAAFTVVGFGWVIQRIFGEHAVSMLRIIVLLFFAFIVLLGLLAASWQHFKRMTAPYLPPDVKG
jgi:hypothetical protein